MDFKRIILLLAVSLILFSCSKKIAYTSNIQKEYKFPQEKLKKVQFYTSSEIILVQTKQEGDVSISDGKLVLTNSKDVEKIVIKKNTPCVLEEIIDDNKFLFSFEFGDGKVLLFGNNTGGCFSLMSKEWKSGVATIQYAGKNYVTDSGGAFMLIKARNLNKLKARQRTVKGRKV